MFRTFKEIEEHILAQGTRKTIALAGSQDEVALSALVTARRKGIAHGILIGDGAKTRELLARLGESASDYEIMEEACGRPCSHLACSLVKEGKADMPMKGRMPTADFMREVLNEEFGFFTKKKGLLSQATVLEVTDTNRLMVISDCAVNVAPDYEDKFKILVNAVGLAHTLGYDCPKVAVVAPLETVNPNIPSTVDAALLSKAAQRGQITGCVVDGPLALDNAVSPVAAREKNIQGEVAGQADVLIMPDLAAGNIFTKSLHYFAHLKQTGSLLGTYTPVVMTSRTETSEGKYHSILIGFLQSN